MSDDNIRRLFEKMDVVNEKVEELERKVERLLTLHEAKDKECERQDRVLHSYDKRISRLEEQSGNYRGGVSTMAWVATFVVAVLGVILH